MLFLFEITIVTIEHPWPAGAYTADAKPTRIRTLDTSRTSASALNFRILGVGW